jgi:hypothetical protein
LEIAIARRRESVLYHSLSELAMGEAQNGNPQQKIGALYDSADPSPRCVELLVKSHSLIGPKNALKAPAIGGVLLEVLFGQVAITTISPTCAPIVGKLELLSLFVVGD